MSINFDVAAAIDIIKAPIETKRAHEILVNHEENTAHDVFKASISLAQSGMSLLPDGTLTKLSPKDVIGTRLGTMAAVFGISDIAIQYKKTGEVSWTDSVAVLGSILTRNPATAVLGGILSLYPLAEDLGEYIGEKGWLDPFFKVFDDTVDGVGDYYEKLITFYGDLLYEWDPLGIRIELDKNPTFSNAESITSPITIDIDGDGLETTSESQGVFFDHDNNGFSEHSGWIKPDDGLLARDLDGNGVISSGAELFGNNTLLKDGTAAANGFEALAELDTNADGVIDVQDEAYADLLVWRDMNGDGSAQTRELFTLEKAGISSISTQYQNVNQADGQGNTVKQLGTATLADGSVTTAADIWFDTSLTLTRTTELLELSDEVTALPNALGFGNLHNLDQAMMRDPELQTLVQAFVSESDDSVRRSMMDDLIYQWAGVANVDPYSRDASRIYGHVMDARQLETLEVLVGREYLGTWCWGERDPNPHGRAAPVLIAQYEEFKTFVYGQLMAQSHYKDAFDLIDIRFDFENGRLAHDLDAFTAHLEALAQEGAVIEVSRIYSVLTMLGSYSSAYETMAEEVRSNLLLAPILAENLIEGSDNNDTLFGTNGDDLIIGGQGDDTLLGNQGDDTYLFEQGDGSNRIYDAGGMDTVTFGQGIEQSALSVTRNATSLFLTLLAPEGQPTGDVLQIDNVFDFDGTLKEGALERFTFADGSVLKIDEVISLIEQTLTDGDDTLYGTEQADTIEALGGNDTLYGGAGDDVYRFSLGDGQDTIFENAGTDTIEFTGGIQSSQVKIERSGTNGEDILVHLFDTEGQPTGDIIRIVKAYQSFAASGNQIEQVLFILEDGSVQLMALSELDQLTSASDQSDIIYGFESDDTIHAQAGLDTLHGAGGADTLYGDGDDDILYGEAGDDTLVGGKGNDILNGGTGSDRYLLASGDGHDIIQNSDAAGIDILEFDSSINPSKVRLLRTDNNLLISIDRNVDSIQINDYFDGDSVSPTAIDQIRFADGSLLTVQDVIDLTLESTMGADFIQGYSSDDNITARGGDDIVYGGRGDDLISGDQGNDLLFGENGNDRLFGQQGADQLYGGQGDDILYGGNEADQLYGSSGRDILHGENGSDMLFGGGQDDTLNGENGADLLMGELGNDTLNGGYGDDDLTGGEGDDRLSGGLGNDTFTYANGDGSDQIATGKKESSGYDTLLLNGFETAQVWLSQQGDDLLVSFVGSNGQVVIEDWQAYGDAVDEIVVGDFSTYGEDIERMVSAMAAFDAPSGVGEVIPQDIKDHLQPVLAASWHSSTATV